MTDLNDAFENAQKEIKTLSSKPDDGTLLKLYALYKQGAVGDVQGDKPGFFDFVGAAKYEAWEQLKGTTSEDAQQQYIDLVNKLVG
ncbi:acyl-CoA-binding protein [Marinicella rhabdoformis]|uniref:acyl-CoA-binding protein n=1 Tax=Marinicella rhabdoformis TaxID=2580566 RepID=UPI0015D0BB5E|nr:acyl-CoA-binding protein [Marinicella rhabdoformis]